MEQQIKPGQFYRHKTDICIPFRVLKETYFLQFICFEIQFLTGEIQFLTGEIAVFPKDIIESDGELIKE